MSTEERHEVINAELQKLEDAFNAFFKDNRFLTSKDVDELDAMYQRHRKKIISFYSKV